MEENKNTVSRNDISVPLVEGRVLKGSDKYVYYFPDVPQDKLVAFLGEDDAYKLLSQAAKEIGRTIHKKLVGDNESLVPGSPTYLELFQAELDNWDATSDSKADMLVAIERVNETAAAVARYGLGQGKIQVPVDYRSVHTKEQISFIEEIPEVPGQNTQVAATHYLIALTTKSEELRNKINAIVRKPRTKKAAEVVPATPATSQEAAPSQSDTEPVA